MLDEATVKRRQTLVDFLRKSCKLAQDFSNEEVHKVLGILSVNSFVVHDGGSDEANSDLIGKQLTHNPKNIVLCSKKVSLKNMYFTVSRLVLCILFL